MSQLDAYDVYDEWQDWNTGKDIVLTAENALRTIACLPRQAHISGISAIMASWASAVCSSASDRDALMKENEHLLAEKAAGSGWQESARADANAARAGHVIAKIYETTMGASGSAKQVKAAVLAELERLSNAS